MPGAWPGVASIAAVFNLLGMPASILGNELAGRIGREKTLTLVMTSSAVMAVVFGFAGGSGMLWVLLIAAIYSVTVTADSATITAGMVAAAEPRYRGATMAVHSLIGFIGAFIGPVLFGIVLDAAGGQESTLAWGLAFTTMGLVVALGPVAVRGLAR
ncbi:MAG: hypothetical protein R3F53_08365 [Gammaproteobacteria bacterium]